MGGGVVLYIFYGSVLFFGIASLLRLLGCIRTPLHSKWELYTSRSVYELPEMYFHSGGSMPAIMGCVKEQLPFNMEYKLHTPILNALHVLFVSPWLVYLPFGHATRLFFRYYHELRWDHVPNLRGNPMEKRIEKLLGKAVSWSAPHVQAGKTRAEVATRLPGYELPSNKMRTAG